MYAKLFSRIAQSSLMEEKVTTRYVFMMMLAMSDRHGDVIGTDVAIARTMNVTLLEFVNSVKPLLAPDPASNSQVEEGRRLVPSENGRGYRIVNYTAYRDMKSDEEKREYMRNYMRNRRSGKEKVTDVKPCKDLLNDVTHTEAEAEEDTKKDIKTAPPLALPFDSADFKLFWSNWEQHRKEKKAKLTPTARNQQLEKLKDMGEHRAIAALKHSLANGWTGIFEPEQAKPNGYPHKGTQETIQVRNLMDVK
jgi:hypothetical protein